MSLTSSGLTAAARAAAYGPGSRQLPFDKVCPVIAADPHHQREPGQAARLRPVPRRRRAARPAGRRRGSRRRRTGRGAAAADHVERLGPGEPGADRDQRGPRGQRAERGEHPGGRVGAPDGDPVAGGDAVGDERAGDLADPLVQLPVAEPRATRLGQGLRVAELPRRAARPRPGSSPGSSAPLLDPTKQVLGRVAGMQFGDRRRRVPPPGRRLARRERARRAARRGRARARARGVRRAAGLEPAAGRRGLDLPRLAGRARRARRHPRAADDLLRGVRAQPGARPGRGGGGGAARADPDRVRHAGAAAAVPAADRGGRGAVVPGLLGTGSRLRPGGGGHHRGARRRRVGDHRPEGVDVAGARGRLVLRPGQDRAGVAPLARACPTCWSRCASRGSRSGRSGS